jgi:hypothetical protein
LDPGDPRAMGGDRGLLDAVAYRRLRGGVRPARVSCSSSQSRCRRLANCRGCHQAANRCQPLAFLRLTRVKRPRGFPVGVVETVDLFLSSITADGTRGSASCSGATSAATREPGQGSNGSAMHCARIASSAAPSSPALASACAFRASRISSPTVRPLNTSSAFSARSRSASRSAGVRGVIDSDLEAYSHEFSRPAIGRWLMPRRPGSQNQALRDASVNLGIPDQLRSEEAGWFVTAGRYCDPTRSRCRAADSRRETGRWRH